MITPATPHGYYDWSGTAVLLEDITSGMTFEQLSGLDPLKWAIVAVELTTGSKPDARTGLILHAIDLEPFGVGSFADRHQVLGDTAARGEVTVHRIVREDIGIAEVLAQMKIAHVQFRANNFRNAELHAAEQGPASAD